MFFSTAFNYKDGHLFTVYIKKWFVGFCFKGGRDLIGKIAVDLENIYLLQIRFNQYMIYKFKDICIENSRLNQFRYFKKYMLNICVRAFYRLHKIFFETNRAL